MPTNAHVLAAGALGLAIGLTAGTLLSQDGPASAPSAVSADPPVAAAAPAADTTASEESGRAALEAENAALRAALAEVRPETLPGPPGAPTPVDAAAPAPGAAAPATVPAGEFDSGALAVIGLPDAEIERLRERYAAFQLEELDLRDQARREGWLRTPRYHREARAQREALRTELGDDGYDAMLYGSGQNNRVVINQPIEGSPAERAGLQAGDSFVSYGGHRILEPGTLIAATAEGTRGEPTELRFERNGEEFRVFLPRGPLGTTLRPERRPPDIR